MYSKTQFTKYQYYIHIYCISLYEYNAHIQPYLHLLRLSKLNLVQKICEGLTNFSSGQAQWTNNSLLQM